MSPTLKSVMAARRRSVVIMVSVIGILLASLIVVYEKKTISVVFGPGETVKAEFPRQYRLINDDSQVKIAGVAVGTVTENSAEPHGDAIVSMKINSDAMEKLGSQPSATIRPVTVLGGKYYVELKPGGEKGRYDAEKTIPVSRTQVPQELDKILGSINKPSREGLQSTVRQLDGTLGNNGQQALGGLVKDAPGTLQPAGSVLTAVEGTRPSTDLTQLVSNLNQTSHVLTQRDGQLGNIVDSLDKTGSALSSSKNELANTVGTLPPTLRATDNGLGELNGTLSRLTTTAANARPTARQLGPLLRKTDPVLRQTQPLVRQLRPLLQEARPVVQELVPTSDGLTNTLTDLKGPLNRLDGPVANALNSPWTGKGYFAGDGGNGHRTYEEVGYMAAHAALLSRAGDKNGQALPLALGVGTSSVGGTDLTGEKILENLGLLPPGTAETPPPSSNPAKNGPSQGPKNDNQPGAPNGLAPALGGLLSGNDK